MPSFPRNAEATRQRLLQAATAEFAEFGIAGARVDRIAANAQTNKAQIYHYFGSKERLFDAVWQALVERIVRDVAVDVDDLPGFAVRLADIYGRNPELMRLITWQRMERNAARNALAVQATQERADAIAAAQAKGLVSGRFEPRVLFALIIHVAALWEMTSPDVHAVVKVSSRRRRLEVVHSAVRALLS